MFISSTVTCQIGKHFLGIPSLYGTLFLAEKHCVKNAILLNLKKMTNLKVVIQN